jgi:hypothetical protein
LLLQIWLYVLVYFKVYADSSSLEQRAELLRTVADLMGGACNEISEGLNAVESWNRANAIIFTARVATSPPTAAANKNELSVLCLRVSPGRPGLRQRSHDPGHPYRPHLGRPATDADRCGLTPLFWTHIQPYDEVALDVGRRLPFCGVPAAATISASGRSGR